MKKTKIYLGADHAGFNQKEKLKTWLQAQGYETLDLGAHKLIPNDDYPKYAFAVGEAVSKEKGAFGILFCGSAEGVCIAANKVIGVRAVVARNVKEAILTRGHNNANVLCLSGWFLSNKKAKAIAKAWLSTPFSKEGRHRRRVKQIEDYEKKRGENG